MKITVFTPTYNRAYIIENLYRSLQRQSFHDFEWLIVDDGSTDNTEELVASWIKEDNPFPIRFYKKENGGKCRAINYGVDRAEGMLFFNVDSDDYLTDDALEKVAMWEESLPKGTDVEFCGVMGNLGTSEIETPNTLLQKPFRDITLLERYSEYAASPIDGERAIVFYTEIQKKYKYPEISGEKFVTEASSWNRMAHDGYKMRVFDDIICVYEYRSDGLTNSGEKIFINNPQGHGLFLKEKAEFLKYPFRKKLKMWYTYYCDHSFHLSNRSISEYIGAPIVVVCGVSILRKVIKLFKRR